MSIIFFFSDSGDYYKSFDPLFVCLSDLINKFKFKQAVLEKLEFFGIYGIRY